MQQRKLPLVILVVLVLLLLGGAVCWKVFWPKEDSETLQTEDASAGSKTAPGAQEAEPGEQDRAGGGTAPLKEPKTGEAGLASENRTVRGFVCDARTGQALSSYFIGTLKNPRGARPFHDLPGFNIFAPYESMAKAFQSLDTCVEVSAADGRFELPWKKVRDRALFVLAKGYRILAVTGHPFGLKPGAEGEAASDSRTPTFKLTPLPFLTLTVLDELNETPIQGVELFIHETRLLDFLSDGHHFGASALSADPDFQTGQRSDGEGKLRIPMFLLTSLHHHGAGQSKRWDGNMLTTLFLKGGGYGSCFYEIPSPLPGLECTVHLSPAASALRVEVYDEENRPAPAFLTVRSDAMGGFGSVTHHATDKQGKCLIEGVPAGKAVVQARDTRENDLKDFPPGAVLNPNGRERRSGMLWAEKTVEVPGSGEIPVVLQLGPAIRRGLSNPVLIIRLEEDPELASLQISYRSRERGSGSRSIDPKSSEYILRLPGPGSYAISTSFSHKRLGKGLTLELGQFQLRSKERRRMNLVIPREVQLFRFSGRCQKPLGDGPLLPSYIHLTVEGAGGKLKTSPRVIGDFGSTKPLDPAKPFDLRLAPGNYRLEGMYSSGKFCWNGYPLGTVKIRKDVTDHVIELPALARVIVEPVDASTGRSLGEHDLGWVIAKAGTDMKKKANQRTYSVLPPGEYTVLMHVPTYEPGLKNFTVPDARAPVHVKVPMTRGTGGVLAGKVVSKQRRTPVQAQVVLFHAEYGFGGYFHEAPGGRFRLDGLPEGRYRIVVWAGESRPVRVGEFFFQLGDKEKKENLVLEVETKE